MAQKRSGRGRPRKSARAATGFPVTRRKRASAKPDSAVTPLPAGVTSSNEPTSAFEALCAVTSAEYERLSNSTTNCDNRSDSSSKSTEENRQIFSSPSDIQLPAWYGAHIAPLKPYKSELILPPKKKKYLHYLAETDDDNQIINNPFPQHEVIRTPTTVEESQQTSSTATSVTPASNLSYSVATSTSAAGPYDTASAAYPHSVTAGSSAEQLAPLKFNPTPVMQQSVRCPDTKTFNDVLDEHISRLIIQNDVIVAKQAAVVMSKRGRSKEGSGIDANAGRDASRTPVSATNESMVKTLLSSKITRKTMLKENACGRLSVRPSGSSFSYLNPENSAIKDLLIKTYGEKGLSNTLLPNQSTSGESAGESADYINGSRQFKTPTTSNSRTGSANGIVYRVTSDQRSGALVVPVTNASPIAGWSVSSGMEWVTIDERGRRRVRPEVTVYPEASSYHPVAPSPGRSIRSPSTESLQSSESAPSSAGLSDTRRVQASGTFQPFKSRGGPYDSDVKMPPPNAMINGNPVKTAGIFHPGSQFSDGRISGQDLTSEVTPESHEKTLNALRGHLTGRRPTEDSWLNGSKSDEAAVEPVVERSSLPPKKRKSFHLMELPSGSSSAVEPSRPLALEPISPASPLDDTMSRRQTVIQEPACSGYPSHGSENQPRPGGFYSDLPRQYPSNVAFAQTLLQQGHYYPSFRYSCVTTNSVQESRPIHVPNGESVSMYAKHVNSPATLSAVDPNIRVDSSIYGKKKTDGSFYSLASKRSANICATSVETYTRKRQLILSGMNSFLPSEAARLSQADLPVVRVAPQFDEGPSTSSERFHGPRVLPMAGGRVAEAIKLEDVSEDEEEEEGACSDCGRKVPGRSRNSECKFTCASCVTGRMRAETFPKQSRPSPQPNRRRSEVVTQRTVKSSDPEKRQTYSEKPLMAQLKQKIIGHQQPGTLGNTSGSRSEPVPVVQPQPTSAQPDSDNPNVQTHDAMDLSVRKPTDVPDWRTLEGVSNKYACQQCPKIFNKHSQFFLHSRVHDIESSGKSDRKTGGKARTERPSSPGSMSVTNENPRPFFCSECNVGFRIHGHLQKHLRSKGHITQLECLNRLPNGFYAELERQNMIVQLHTMIDTADCAKALNCLTQLSKTVIAGMPPLEDQTTVSVVPS